MSSIVSIPGSDALSSFRLDKIRQEAARLGVALGELSARYWHFLLLVWIALFVAFSTIDPEVAARICGTR